MRIGIDLRMVGGGSGIDRYITELAHEILSARGSTESIMARAKPEAKLMSSGGKPQHEYVLFFKDAQQSENYKMYGQKIIVTGIKHYSFAEQLLLPFVLYKENLDLIHFPHFNVPILYFKKFVVTIHDLTHTRFPGRKKSRFIWRLGYNLIILNAIKRASKVIAVSLSTKNELAEFFGRKKNVEVIYEGTNSKYQMVDKDQAFREVLSNFDIAKPYLLYVGVWRRYRNLPNLIKAYDLIRTKGLDYDLVLVGEQDPFYPEIMQEVKQSKFISDIKILGRVKEDSDLNLLYNAATLFVLPSLAEGFGLTVLEAATVGTPVAASDIPTLREVLGSAAEFFDPNNVENIADILESLLANPNRLEELANLGLKRSKMFSWKMAAEKTMNVYKQA